MPVKHMAGPRAAGSQKVLGYNANAMCLQVRAASGNGATPAGSDREYDYDLFTIGAGSGGVRASRFAASTYGECLSKLHSLARHAVPWKWLQTYPMKGQL